MARIDRRSYFAAPQRRAGTHVLSPPRLRSGELCLQARIAKRGRGTMRIDDRGVHRTRAEGCGCVWIGDSRRKGYEGSRCCRSYRFLGAVRNFRVGRSRSSPTSYSRDRKGGRAIAEISGLRTGRPPVTQRLRTEYICIRGLKAFST